MNAAGCLSKPLTTEDPVTPLCSRATRGYKDRITREESDSTSKRWQKQEGVIGSEAHNTHARRVATSRHGHMRGTHTRKPQPQVSVA